MLTRITKKLVLISASLILLQPSSGLAQQPEQKRTRLEIVVTAAESSEAVAGAEVFVKSEAEDSESGMFEETVTTNRRGLARLSSVPRGTVLIQVTARGCKNFGKRYDLNQESQTIEIKLEKASDQFQDSR